MNMNTYNKALNLDSSTPSDNNNTNTIDDTSIIIQDYVTSPVHTRRQQSTRNIVHRVAGCQVLASLNNAVQVSPLAVGEDSDGGIVKQYIYIFIILYNRPSIDRINREDMRSKLTLLKSRSSTRRAFSANLTVEKSSI